MAKLYLQQTLKDYKDLISGESFSNLNYSIDLNKLSKQLSNKFIKLNRDIETESFIHVYKYKIFN